MRTVLVVVTHQVVTDIFFSTSQADVLLHPDIEDLCAPHFIRGCHGKPSSLHGSVCLASLLAGIWAWRLKDQADFTSQASHRDVIDFLSLPIKSLLYRVASP